MARVGVTPPGYGLGYCRVGVRVGYLGSQYPTRENTLPVVMCRPCRAKPSQAVTQASRLAHTPSPPSPPTSTAGRQRQQRTTSSSRGLGGLETRHVSSPRYVSFVLSLIQFLLTISTYRFANEGQRGPTKANEGQRRPTTAHDRPTQPNEGPRQANAAQRSQRQPTTGQRRPAKANAGPRQANAGQRRPPKANEGPRQANDVDGQQVFFLSLILRY
jgi:hypothetical protein